MVSSTRLYRRRTLRPVEVLSLSELSVVQDSESEATVTILGGPPLATALVLVDGELAGRVDLDRLGAGTVEVEARLDEVSIRIECEGRVLASGELPRRAAMVRRP